MYLPAHFAFSDPEEIVLALDAVGAVDLVTSDSTGKPHATLMPVTWDRQELDTDSGNFGTLVMHMARANKHWETIVNGAPALAILHGPQAYVSPSAYESKREHGKVVPTWDYISVQFEGLVSVTQDVDELRRIVTDLTDLHESRRDHSWRVSDAPEPYIAGQLRGIVGVTLRVTGISGKAKLSQNRSMADRTGVAEDLKRSARPDDRQIAQLIDRTLSQPSDG